MNRRNFLKGGSALAAISLFAGRSKVFAASEKVDFSLEILTDVPGDVLKLANSILPGINGNNTVIKQHKLIGRYTGDIVFIQNNQVFDFYKSNTELARKLQGAVKSLNLPAQVSNPTLIQFRPSSANATPDKLNVFVDNILVDRFNINSNLNEHIITSNKGELVLNLADKKAKIISSSCKHQTCMHKGHIHGAGENIVCIPNSIRISLDGSRSGIDAITE